MSQQNENPFDPFQRGDQGNENPNGYAPGYGSFGNNPQGQQNNNPQQNQGQSTEQNQGNGGFYGPDFFSGNNGGNGGNQSFGTQGNGGFGNNPQGNPYGGGFFGQGNTPPPPPQPPVKQKSRGYGFSIASLVCGIVSVVGCCCTPFIPLLLSLVAIAMSIVQTVMDKKMNGFSIGGLVTGIVGFIIAVASLIFMATDAYDAFMEEYNKMIEDMENGTYDDDLSANDPNGMIDVEFSENEF